MPPACDMCRVSEGECSRCSPLRLPVGWRREPCGNAILLRKWSTCDRDATILAVPSAPRCLLDACGNASAIASPFGIQSAALVWPFGQSPNDADVRLALKKMASNLHLAIVAVGVAATSVGVAISSGASCGNVAAVVLVAPTAVPSGWKTPSRVLFMFSASNGAGRSAAAKISASGRHHVEIVTVRNNCGADECRAVTIGFFARSFAATRAAQAWESRAYRRRIKSS